MDQVLFYNDFRYINTKNLAVNQWAMNKCGKFIIYRMTQGCKNMSLVADISRVRW